MGIGATEKPRFNGLGFLFVGNPKDFDDCYISIVSGASKIDAIWFLYIESACMTSFDNLQY